jgi:predicted nucleotidyltransferase component of viral defense system
MITKEIADYIISKTGINNFEFIEKDMVLHNLLFELSKVDYFLKNYIFKGGTCLIKAYLGYYRFSEDLDFTYMKQKDFEGKSKNAIDKIISSEVDYLINIFVQIASNTGMRFKNNKRDIKYVEFGGSNTLVTFKFWYDSLYSKKENFIKIQINFLENLRYNPKLIDVNSLINSSMKEEISFRFGDEWAWMTSKPSLLCYDLREILLEKCRAILTRRGLKFRDFIDLYNISNSISFKLEDYEKGVIDKVIYSLKYEKYRINIEVKEFKEYSLRSDEERLLIKPVTPDFDVFYNKLIDFIANIGNKFKLMDNKEDKSNI